MSPRYTLLALLLTTVLISPIASGQAIVQLPDQVDNDAGYNGEALAQLPNGDILVVYVKNGVTTNPGGFPPEGPPAQLILTRSSDGGNTWSSSDTLRTAIPNGTQSIAQPLMVVLSSGRILLSYFYETAQFPNYMAGEEAMYSDDNGATWMPYDVDDRDIQVLVASSSSESPQPPLVAVYWKERNSNGDLDFWTATSTDEGATWTNERFLAQTDPICGVDLYAASDTDWTFLWADCFFGLGGTYTIYRQQTTDGGATWSSSEPLFTAESGFGTRQNLIIDANGRQSILYSDGLTMAYRTSDDGGTTWSAPVDWSQGTAASGDIIPTCAAGLDTPLCVFQSRRGSTNLLLHFASIDALTTDAEGSADELARVTLSQNAPNPTTGTTRLTFELAQSADITLTLHDLLGRQVRQLVSGPRSAGSHVVMVDASDLPSGVYIYRLATPEGSVQNTLTVLR